jgi:glycosyltransferase involved in cell wall biosynthesis
MVGSVHAGEQSEPMEIVFPLMGFSVSGGVRALIEHASGLARRGHRVLVLVARPSWGPSFPLDERVELRQSAVRRLVLGEMLWLLRQIPQTADAVVANYYLTAYPVALATHLQGPKGYYFVQGYEPGIFSFASNRRYRALQRVLAALSYWLPLNQIVVSSWLGRQLPRSASQTLPIVNEGVDTSIFTPHPRHGRNNAVHRIMTIARSAPGKGLQDFELSMRILAKEMPNSEVLLVSQERSLAIDTPLSSELVHPVDDAELARCYNRSDVFVFPSLQEGFGIPPLEAMACGIPVVTTDCGGVLDYALDGVNCLVVPVGDPQAIARSVQRILTDRSLAERLSEAGIETARRHTWDAMVDKMESILGSR